MLYFSCKGLEFENVSSTPKDVGTANQGHSLLGYDVWQLLQEVQDDRNRSILHGDNSQVLRGANKDRWGHPEKVQWKVQARPRHDKADQQDHDNADRRGNATKANVANNVGYMQHVLSRSIFVGSTELIWEWRGPELSVSVYRWDNVWVLPRLLSRSHYELPTRPIWMIRRSDRFALFIFGICSSNVSLFVVLHVIIFFRKL